jgi:hypothetical protein
MIKAEKKFLMNICKSDKDFIQNPAIMYPRLRPATRGRLFKGGLALTLG